MAGLDSMFTLPNADLITQRMFYNPECLTPQIANLAFDDIRSPKRFRASLRALRVMQEYDAIPILPRFVVLCSLSGEITIGSLRSRIGCRTWRRSSTST